MSKKCYVCYIDETKYYLNDDKCYICNSPYLLDSDKYSLELLICYPCRKNRKTIKN